MKIRLKQGYWISFPYKYALPPDSIISNWISILGLITNDLSLTNKNLINEFQRNPKKGTPETPYYLWLTCTHYREATKFLNESVKIPEISLFIDSLPESIKEQYENVQKVYNPYDGSFAKTVIKPIRDTFIHYPKLTTIDWASLWSDLKTEEGELHQRGGAIGDSRWIFADDIRINMINKSLEDSGYTIEKVLSPLGAIMTNMITFTQTVIIEYFDGLPEGIISSGKRTKTTFSST